MLKNAVEDIRKGLDEGRYPNEPSVGTGIVLRILNELGWPTYEPQIVWPEYVVEGLRVDFALCHPATKPQVFIEVKRVGLGDSGLRQLFEYAFHQGVPFAILTDGREWNFFLPAEAGDYIERRVYKLDLVERNIEESILRLERYLGYNALCSGAALQAARDDQKAKLRIAVVAQTLPQAWLKLVEEEDDLLLELLADRVESLCGYKPDPDVVARFLSEEIMLRPNVPPPRVPNPMTPKPPPGPIPSKPGRPTGFGFTLMGQVKLCKNARDVLLSVMEALTERDPTFPERFAAHPHHGRTRRYIARERRDLYPGREDLAEEHSHQLRSGYWIGTNVSRVQVERIIKTACQVARLHYGNDLKINLS